MRKTTSLLLAVFSSVIMIGCTSSNTGSISGKLSHAANRTLELVRVTEEGEMVLDSTSTDHDGNFSIPNPVKETDYYLLRTGPESIIYLILSGGENILISGDLNMLGDSYTVTGSTECEFIRSLHQGERKLTDSLNKVFNSFRSVDPYQADSMGRVLEYHYSVSIHRLATELIRSNPSLLASLSATKFLDQASDIPLLELLADSLNKRYNGNRYVEDYLTFVKDLKSLPPGATAPDITLNGLDGKKISIADYRGKYLLIDFWASWCQPCRRANPDLRRLYAKYKCDRLEFIGVALDDNMDSWKKAVKLDALPWPQMSELKKWDSKCVADYKISAIPFSILIDPEGKIVAKGLRPEDLDMKIQEVLRKNS